MCMLGLKWNHISKRDLWASIREKYTLKVVSGL